MNLKKTNTNKGITLIALVITVIVLLILAGTAISIAVNGGNIFAKANTAVDTYNQKAAQQQAAIETLNTQFDEYYTGYNPNQTPAGPIPTLSTTLPTGWSTTAVAGAYTDGTADTRQVPIPKGFVASSATGENTIAGGLVIYKGTEAVTDDNVATAQTTRDQYVWIPVENATSESIWDQETVTADTTVLSDGDGTNVDETKEPTTLTTDFTAMQSSVAKYGGFYISRYELGGTTSMPTSVKGQTVLSADSSSANQWYGLYDAAHQDVKDSTNTNTVLKGHMIFGSEYEKVLSFIDSNNEGDTANNKTYSQTGHASKQETIVHNSGTVTQEDKELDIVNNIVDLEGNLCELTAQAIYTNRRVFRGGLCNYAVYGVFKPVSFSGGSYPNDADSVVGVRQSLYVAL